MTTVTIKVPKKATDRLSALVKELGGEIISVTAVKKNKKNTLLAEIATSLKEVKEIKAGKGKSYSMDDLLNGE